MFGWVVVGQVGAVAGVLWVEIGEGEEVLSMAADHVLWQPGKLKLEQTIFSKIHNRLTIYEPVDECISKEKLQ